MKIKLFKKQKKFKKENPESIIKLFWKLFLVGVFIVLLLAVFFGYYLFMKTGRDSELSVVEDSRHTETINIERIDKVLQYFSDREKKSAEILNSPAPVIDPSL